MNKMREINMTVTKKKSLVLALVIVITFAILGGGTLYYYERERQHRLYLNIKYMVQNVKGSFLSFDTEFKNNKSTGKEQLIKSTKQHLEKIKPNITKLRNIHNQKLPDDIKNDFNDYYKSIKQYDNFMDIYSKQLNGHISIRHKQGYSKFKRELNDRGDMLLITCNNHLN